ncbi:M1 family aminopeptidase [Galbibacter marinus]|uniref:M1 family aminopeptidase n=1 Tax=Galbibacter marinus TaxID=555500 RepID=K2Q7H3_9FLAO|nr:M1 family metallopeptidase [Galbibacter marinus]EKF56796.1 M1 family aminopeptidase [Galbibacter marinus]
MRQVILTVVALTATLYAQAKSPVDPPINQKATSTNDSYWQQQADYKMDIEMDVENFQFTGTQQIKYTNNSPNSLDRVFYHLYFNAFQPGSEMDMRLQTIPDPDRRMVNNLGTKENPKYQSRIAELSEDEIGYLKVSSLTKNGKTLQYSEEGTTLVVTLDTPIKSGETVTFDMEFTGQVPVQIRRSGRNNKDGVALSMTQWYPKMAEYDFEGWHADPYIAREFHGVWGDYDVNITIDKDYIIGGTGVLQNANEIGYGYQDEGVKVKRHRGKTLTWNFKAHDVHDFAWAADPEYIHDRIETPEGVTLHFLYKGNDKVVENWKKVQEPTAEMLTFFSKNIGPYPWEQYSVIQGGDGGMEYAMCTLITGGENYGSLFGTTAHEFAHAWFQQLLATNESAHPWMDEGFTTFISTLAENQINGDNEPNPFKNSYRGYQYIVESGKEQPLSTHADRYEYNAAYSVAAYSKGSIFLSQLGYVIGQDKLMETLKEYYEEFKYTHPTPNDFIRVAEKVSGTNLNWYLTDWTKTTNTIDYGIEDVSSSDQTTTVNLKRIGLMPMPIDVMVFYQDGTMEYFYIPLQMMYGEKGNPFQVKRNVLQDWVWGNPNYSFEIQKPKSSIKAVVIDPSNLMADVDRSNNTIQLD